MTAATLRAAAALALLVCAWLAAAPASATFVHMVGRVWMIEQWVAKEFDGRILELTPITYEGNPAFRVSFVPGGASGASSEPPRTLIIDAGSMAPIAELQGYVPPGS